MRLARSVAENLGLLTHLSWLFRPPKIGLRPTHFTQNNLLTFLEAFPSFPACLEALAIDKTQGKTTFFENVVFLDFHLFGVPHGHFWGAS